MVTADGKKWNKRNSGTRDWQGKWRAAEDEKNDCEQPKPD